MPWTEDELRALPASFTANYKSGVAPGEAAIKAAMANFPILKRRTIAQIKSRAQYDIRQSRQLK